MGQRKKLPSPFSQSLTTTGSSGLAHAALQQFWGKDEVTNKRSARGAAFCPAALDQAGKKQRESPLDSVGRKGGEWEQPLLGTLLSSLHIQSSHDESIKCCSLRRPRVLPPCRVHAGPTTISRAWHAPTAAEGFCSLAFRYRSQ